MKLYEFSPAPNAMRVSIFLAELSIEVARVNVDIRGGENLSQQFKQHAPNGKFPTLSSMMAPQFVNQWPCAATSI